MKIFIANMLSQMEFVKFLIKKDNLQHSQYKIFFYTYQYDKFKDYFPDSMGVYVLPAGGECDEEAQIIINALTPHWSQIYIPDINMPNIIELYHFMKQSDDTIDGIRYYESLVSYFMTDEKVNEYYGGELFENDGIKNSIGITELDDVFGIENDQSVSFTDFYGTDLTDESDENISKLKSAKKIFIGQALIEDERLNYDEYMDKLYAIDYDLYLYHPREDIKDIPNAIQLKYPIERYVNVLNTDQTLISVFSTALMFYKGLGYRIEATEFDFNNLGELSTKVYDYVKAFSDKVN